MIFGNAGSFFKNPIISKSLLRCLLDKHPDMPFYVHKNNLLKLSARWLIDHCCLERYKFGHAEVYKNQSLILINVGQKATSCEIFKLALHIYDAVLKKFHVYLEPEVQFISSFGKINGIKLLSIKDFILNYSCN